MLTTTATFSRFGLALATASGAWTLAGSAMTAGWMYHMAERNAAIALDWALDWHTALPPATTRARRPSAEIIDLDDARRQRA